MGGSGRRGARVGLAFLVALAARPSGAGPLGWGAPLARPASTPSLATAPADLALVWVDVMGTARFAYPEAAAEVVSLLGRMGVRATIRQAAARSVSGPSELTVVLLPGRTPGTPLDHRVMGATSRSPENVRAIWVYAAGVAASLGLDPRRGPHWALTQRREFATALGRVVAHELVHALAPQRPHVKGGLMAASMGRALLLSSDLAIDAGTSEALRAALGGGPATAGTLATLPEPVDGGAAARP